MRIGIGVKIGGIVLGAVVLLGGGVGTFFAIEQDRTMRGDLDRRMELFGLHLGASVEGAVEEGDARSLELLLQSAVLDPEVAYVLVKAPDGEIRAARWVSQTSGAVSERAFPIHAPAPGATPTGLAHLFGAVGEVYRGPLVGTLAVGVDLSPLAESRRRVVVRTVVAVGIGAAVASALGLAFVSLLIRGSVRPLLAGIRTLGARDLSHRLPVRRDEDELDEVARAFNEMAERLSATLVTKEELGATIERRTEELRKALDERVRAQEAVTDREEWLQLILESAAEAIYGIDRDGRCTFCNPACVRLLGYGAARELVGRNMHDLVHHSTAAGTPLAERECRLLRTLSDGQGYHATSETFWRADGTPVEVECWSYPLLRGGVQIGAVVTFLDVTDRRRLEGELFNMKKLESIGVLAGGIAHDFNHMLTGILGNLFLAKEDAGDPVAVRELLAEAEQATLRAKHLTQQLLTFSRGGAPVKRVVALRDVVHQSASFALSGSAVRGEYTYPVDLWPVEADPGQIGQVMQNLVINAVQAMPQGGVVSVACENVQLPAESPLPLEAGRYVKVSIVDRGVGILAEHLARVFDPYFTTKREGSGLGLATVYSIVKSHGGHVAVRSVVGRGTTFEVYLPATQLAAHRAEPPALEARSGGGRVLVMDDDPAVRSVARNMLARLGYEVSCATEGSEAVEAFRRAAEGGRAYDAVLVDLTVPGGMGGVETVARLRAIDPAVRAVATSGYSGDGAMARFREQGFAAVVAKPYTLEELGRAVGEAVRGRRGEGITRAP